MARSLLDLPNETSLGILETLKVQDLLACYATCRRLHTLIASSVALQYTIELYASGMLDGVRGPHTLPVQDRLDRLRRHTAAWEELRWTNRVSLPHLIGCDCFPKVSGEVVTFQRDDEDEEISSLYVQLIPSELRAIEGKFVIHPAPEPSHLTQIHLDAAQELIVFRERTTTFHRLRLRSLFVDEFHPSAWNLGFIDYENLGLPQQAMFQDVCGDLLIMSPGPREAYPPILLNWKSGLSEANGAAVEFGTWMFLDDRHTLSFVVGKNNPRQPACLRISALAPANPAEAVPPSYDFVLPECLKHNIMVHGEAPLGPNFESAHAWRGCFYPDRADRLITLRALTSRSAPGFIIDVLASTFTRYIAAHKSAAGEPAVIVPWDAWGTHGARFTALEFPAVSWTSSGFRRALWGRSGDSTVLTVLDYCPRRVARAIARGTATVLHGAEVGAQYTGADVGPLHTLLPCIATEFVLPEDLAHERLYASICEDGVVFVKRHGQLDIVVDACAYTI
ncbi:hypothetical protein BV25DRAFT_1828914 [Artomyces pyxidatus]|uniref:Uncharacterized protein n=1 Tax=Artomyces pyxidatus TaxID=48021 RepID=A0ACB8SUZ5_9AGAM|nr:hypothetical protein BV25DRAFT_1828914 [Artomyces pyxidatus]